MANSDRHLNYSDFTTILLAPSAFISANTDGAEHFDARLPYELVAEYVPEFGEALK